MTKFRGVIGYAESVDIGNGVWEDTITEYTYRGKVDRNTRQLVSGDQVNNDLSVNNSISIVADAYAREHFTAMRYIMWLGVRWEVSNVSVEPPRLVLKLGGVYNGPTAPAPDAP